MIVVPDAGPLICPSGVGELELLRVLDSRVVVPRVVHSEVVVAKPDSKQRAARAPLKLCYPSRVAPFDRITFDPNVLGGRACIRGMRLPVSVIVAQLAHGATRQEILVDFPDLEPADVEQALKYAAWLTTEEVP